MANRPLSPFLRYFSSINSRTATRTGVALTLYRLDKASNVSRSDAILPERILAIRSCLIKVAIDIDCSQKMFLSPRCVRNGRRVFLELARASSIIDIVNIVKHLGGNVTMDF